MFLASDMSSAFVNIIIHKIIILPVVAYGCETWSPARRKYLNLFQNRGLRRVNGSERGEISSITMKTATFSSARVRRVRDTCILFGKENGSVETTRGPAFRQT
jgi:hypothetical protein